MPTYKICVFKHQQRKDGTYPVSISLYWQGLFGYISTEYHVTSQQIRKINSVRAGKKVSSLELKDSFIISELNNRINTCKKNEVEKIGIRIYEYSAKELARYHEKELKQGTDPSIDFTDFSHKHCEKLISKDKKKTASGLLTAVNAMIDFCNGRKNIPITEINAKFLEKYCDYLKTERSITRINQFGKPVTTIRQPVSDIGVFDYLTAIRTLFNAAKKEYNDEDRGEIRIRHYPFKKFFPDKPKEPEKRVIGLEALRLLRDIKDETLTDKRAILARDVFMISFYLAGMNLADIYHLQGRDYKKGRFTYCRQKTRDRRQDNALISIKVFPELLPSVEKYEDKTGPFVFSFADAYGNHETFQQNVNKGLKKVAEKVNEGVKLQAKKEGTKPDENMLLPEDLSTYYARFTFATIARNKCGISRDDIDLALNHVDQGLKMADRYIDKDWSLIDEVIRKVIEYVM